jgi:hypothetical protein
LIQVEGNDNCVELGGGSGNDIIAVDGDCNTGMIDGGAGDDVILLRGQHNRLDINGGEGKNDVILQGKKEDWRVFNLFGFVSFVYNPSSGEFYRMANIDKLNFSDDQSSIDLNETSYGWGNRRLTNNSDSGYGNRNTSRSAWSAWS